MRSSADPFSCKTSEADKNYFEYNHLKSPEIVLRAYNKWRNIYSRNPIRLDKNSKHLWHLSHDPLPPSLLTPSLLDGSSTPIRCVLDGAPRPSPPNQWLLYLTRRGRPPAHLISSISKLKRLNFWWALFFQPASNHKMEVLSQAWQTKNSEASVTLIQACLQAKKIRGYHTISFLEW